MSKTQGSSLAINRTIIKIDAVRYLRDPSAVFFSVGLPVIMYTMFGGTASYGSIPVGNGNVAMSILINISIYGAVTGVVGFAAMAAIERIQGWGRQVALTPLTDASFLLNKALTAALIALLPLTALYIVGHLMSAESEFWPGILSFAIILVLSPMFVLYGVAIALIFRSEIAVSIAVGLLVLFGFAANIFTPLSGILLSIAKFTPLYGYGVLARYPVTEGNQSTATGEIYMESIWLGALNYAAWFVIFALLALPFAAAASAKQTWPSAPRSGTKSRATAT